MAFAIDDPKVFTSGEPFCPCLLWDLEQNPANGGFFTGSNGLVITAVNPSQSSSTIPVTENVVQFNWAYDGAPDPPFGAPVETNCIQIEGAGQCTISLKTGWNIISSWIMPADPDLKTIFQPLITEGKLVKIQDESGFSLEDLGFLGGWTNNIGNFMPGEGYKIKLTTSETLTIFESYPKSSVSPKSIESPKFYKPVVAGNGVDHMNINLVELPADLKPGDEIGVFDRNLCVGAMVIDNRYSVFGNQFLVSSKSEITNLKSQISPCALCPVPRALQKTDYRLPITDYRSLITDYRLPITRKFTTE